MNRKIKFENIFCYFILLLMTAIVVIPVAWMFSTSIKDMDEIFALQEKLNQRIGVKMAEMNDDDRAQWILNYIRAMQQELAELTDSVPWKWWAKYQEFDKQNAKVEIVDLFHFLISLAQVMGMTSDDVFNAYLEKNKVNHTRQDSGYKMKDENDSRHI